MRRCSSAGCKNQTRNKGWCEDHFQGTVKVPISGVVLERRKWVWSSQKRFDRLMAMWMDEFDN